MKLSDIHSQELLPQFAHDISWVMDALDAVIKPTAYRVQSLDAPLTLEAIQALSDDDLERLYERYGVAKYYPDLSRATRDMMLYQMCRIYRYLGTPKAVEILCNYIFDSAPLNLTVLDNLAFDADGNLIDSALLDLFDIQINPLEPVLDEDTNARILANIIRFSRNSQDLRDILYDFVQTFSVDVKWALNNTNPEVTQTWIQDSLCEPVAPPPTPDGILLGVKYRTGQGFTAEAFTRSGAWWWAGFVDQAGKDEALALGCTTTTASDCPCPLGVLCKNMGYNYEVIGLYSDVEGTIPVTEFDPADFSIALDYIPAYGSPATIQSSRAYPSDVKAMTYRVKITSNS